MTQGDALWRDLVFAVRLFRKSPVVTAATLLTLALGVGANVAVFSVVNAYVLRPLPVRDANRLVVIATHDAQWIAGLASFSPRVILLDHGRLVAEAA